ncbi:hypothetical protein BGZ82_003479, partial [Podila clonocystis]
PRTAVRNNRGRHADVDDDLLVHVRAGRPGHGASLHGVAHTAHGQGPARLRQAPRHFCSRIV